MSATLVHPFEDSGLGLAPFRLVSVTTGGLRGCAHCGTAIKVHCLIRSSDGRTFIVGSDCVLKTSAQVDRSLSLEVRKALNAIEREKRDAKREAKWQAVRFRVMGARELLAAKPTLFADAPHPCAYYNDQGLTRRDHIEFLLQRGGMAGKTDACKLIEREFAR